MSEKRKNEARPAFPKRAVVTAGMPYGSKELHLGHVGGVFIHADTFARFLRDRIGKENVLFISGTDCYGSPIVERHRQMSDAGEFSGGLPDFVRHFHEAQEEVLKEYQVELNLFAASGVGRSREIHREVSAEFIETLYKSGHLKKLTNAQFYDPERNIFLNGRQVVGQCPVAGCRSERGYADECSLGHQYMPQELINPVSTLSGKKPEMRDVTNWYVKLEEFQKLLEQWADKLEEKGTRNFVVKSIREFLEPPCIYLKKEYLDEVGSMENLPAYTLREEENKTSARLLFSTLSELDDACRAFAARGIRYRTGKTLVPFRLTGNIDWGVPAPELEGLSGLTFWVWPESLWAPISFTETCLENMGKPQEKWKDWWCSREAQVYQFIGEDNVYFYGPAEMAMFMGCSKAPSVEPPEGELQLPELVVNNHILFLDKKASSSGDIKPPTARELLRYYTPEQLRTHFLGLGLGIKSVSFQPKPFNPAALPGDSDPVLREGNLLSNVYNRAARSCFYTAQKYYEGRIPVRKIGAAVLDEARETILAYERHMAKYEFHLVMALLDTYIRNINKYWAREMKAAEDAGDDEKRAQVLADTFHMVRTAATLLHPIVPQGAEMLREYLRVDERLWSWEHIFDLLYSFMGNPETHALKFLEPRVDFFKRHESQFA